MPTNPPPATRRPGDPNDEARLIELARSGDMAACEELDRRGVEPPVLEPDTPVIPESLDLTTETRPNTGFLREYAGAMKLEAAVMGGHTDAYFDQIKTRAMVPAARDAVIELGLDAARVAAALSVTADTLIAFTKRVDQQGWAFPIAQDGEAA